MFSYWQFYSRTFYCDLLKIYYDKNGKVAVAFISFIFSISGLNEKGDIVNLLIIDEKKELII